MGKLTALPDIKSYGNAMLTKKDKVARRSEAELIAIIDGMKAAIRNITATRTLIRGDDGKVEFVRVGDDLMYRVTRGPDGRAAALVIDNTVMSEL